MTLQEFRKLPLDSRLEYLFQQSASDRAEISVIHEEISHFRELEKDRKRLRKRRAMAAKLEEVGK